MLNSRPHPVLDALYVGLGVLLCAFAVAFAATVAVVGAKALVRHADAPPVASCVLEYHLAEDGSWDGHGVTVDGLRIADHWRVADYHLEDTITADQYGTIGLNVVWTPGYKGTPCELVRTFTDS